jgi:glycosidase
MLEKYRSERHPDLISRDVDGTNWMHSSETVGMMLYVDLFADNLKGLISKSDYFTDLGVTLIHLMPILKPRMGENDGGYAVQDYRDIDPRIGNMEDFMEMVGHFHQKGIRICIDYVINHTSDDHEWAIKAKSGDETYQKYYLMYDDDVIPRQFENTLPEVFPKVAPGNFTYNENLSKWIMTTFYTYQWDLNYRNPQVFHDMVDNLLFMANAGVDLVRLDAIPYVWKALGTDCRNLPEAHMILSLFRDIISYCAPSTALLGEAIIAPELIIRYFGSEDKPECHSLYNASYMVEIWNSLATRDARHLALMPEYELPTGITWINYARCHDDIGWGLDLDKTRSLGFDPQAHKQFLIDFYLGVFNDSFSIGELYEFNPRTGDARNSGTLASLAGMEKAIKTHDHYQMELSIKRINLINALYLLKKGIPMIYSGDELAQLNDYNYKEEIDKRNDSRWLHRPKMKWHLLDKINQPLTPTSQVYNSIRKIINLRKSLCPYDVIQQERILYQGNPHILILEQRAKESETKILLCYNLTEDRQWFYASDLRRYGIEGEYLEMLQGKTISFDSEKVLMGPYEFFVTIERFPKKDLLL